MNVKMNITWGEADVVVQCRIAVILIYELSFRIQYPWLHLLSDSIQNCDRMFTECCSDLSIDFNSIIVQHIACL